MAKILAISSYVARGYVGLAAIVPTLQALGHEVIAVPSVVLSNHYGYQNVGVSAVEPEEMQAMFDAMEANAGISDVDAVLTGYFPSPVHISIAAKTIDQLKASNPGLVYLCDPVLGDDPGGLYVPPDTAAAIKSELLGLADILTPNRFELSWLTGESVDDVNSASHAAGLLGRTFVAVTSVPAGEMQIANVFKAEESGGNALTARRSKVPHGTGDLFAALVLGHFLNGCDGSLAVAAATAGVAYVVEASLGRPELKLVETVRRAVRERPAPPSDKLD